INIAEEARGYDPAAARLRVGGIGDTLQTIFDRSEETGESPLAAAMELARRRLNGGAPQRGSEAARASGPGRSTPAGRRPSA
ncbi:MAG: hypothetical protein ACXVRW_09945, partial [Solirubrobacteraceae bacterium]